MNYAVIIVAIMVGALLGSAGMMMEAQTPDLDADKICNNRLEGGNWTGEQMYVSTKNMSAKIECTNGNRTEELGVAINVTV